MTRFTLTAAMAMGLYAGSMAAAQPAPPPGGGPQVQQPGPGPGAGPNWQARLDKLFGFLDANKDGKIDREEFNKQMPAAVKRIVGRLAQGDQGDGPRRPRARRGDARGPGQGPAWRDRDGQPGPRQQWGFRGPRGFGRGGDGPREFWGGRGMGPRMKGRGMAPPWADKPWGPRGRDDGKRPGPRWDDGDRRPAQPGDEGEWGFRGRGWRRGWDGPPRSERYPGWRHDVPQDGW